MENGGHVRWKYCRDLLSGLVWKMSVKSVNDVAGPRYLIWFGKWLPSQLMMSQGPVIWFGLEMSAMSDENVVGTCYLVWFGKCLSSQLTMLQGPDI
jgi:hypothetical protein